MTATLAFALALAATTPAQATRGESWDITCGRQGCSVVGDIAHGEADPARHMAVVVALRPGGDVKSVTFELPPDADEGQPLAVTFADTVKDDTGNWTVKLVDGATRMLNVQDCAGTCVLSLPNGIVPAGGGIAEFDLAKAMTTHNLMLMFYFSHGERIRASAALFRFKPQFEAAKARSR